MQKHLKILAFALVASGFSQPALAQDGTTIGAETVLATVNGQDITLGHMIAARATLDERYDQIPPQELYNGILEQLIQQTALSQQIEELRPLVALTLENEERSLKAAEVIEGKLQDAVSEADIQAAYDAQYGDIDPQEEFNASHILVASQEEAIAIKEALDGGADFAATAREKSTGPSGPNGGQLGWFSAGMMVPPFEAATIALEVGEVSDPVETQFGWHVIVLNDTRKANIPTLEETRESLLQDLRNQAVVQILTDATKTATIELPAVEGIDPAMITQQDLLDQ